MKSEEFAAAPCLFDLYQKLAALKERSQPVLTEERKQILHSSLFILR